LVSGAAAVWWTVADKGNLQKNHQVTRLYDARPWAAGSEIKQGVADVDWLPVLMSF
jgi:hypothetical protein